MTALNKICIRYSPLSNRILIARFGKDPECALETRDGMNDFLQSLVQYAFDGDMPHEGEAAEVNFGGGNEQFVLTLRRKATLSANEESAA
ncbi:hypothetical protein [Rhizobium laguerreae]|uniref:Uncharacterized protein n=1 Tax=Rhizobium laguerreae TaxID=1076926 RepID=A0A7Y2RB92_9HYPH|nr:hypothetical protein [Rhizobium laguerreae]NNH67799.1 hypothetical protein [Rhizobium laguerreae]